MRRTLFVAVLVCIGAVCSVRAQDQPHVFRGGTIYPITGEPITNGVLVVQDGRFVAVGASGSVSVPAGAVEHDVSGKVIMPGLVDTHSHIRSEEHTSELQSRENLVC